MPTDTPRRGLPFGASLFALGACLALGACAYARPDPVATPGLDSGVTAGSGGGTQVLRNNPNMGVTTPTGPTRY